MMTREQNMLEELKFIRDACSRIKLAQGTNDYEDVLDEELEDIEKAALRGVTP